MVKIMEFSTEMILQNVTGFWPLLVALRLIALLIRIDRETPNVTKLTFILQT